MSTHLNVNLYASNIIQRRPYQPDTGFADVAEVGLYLSDAGGGVGNAWRQDVERAF